MKDPRDLAGDIRALGEHVGRAFTAAIEQIAGEKDAIIEAAERAASRNQHQVAEHLLLEVETRLARFRDNYVLVTSGQRVLAEGPRYVAAPDENGCWQVTDTQDGEVIWQAVYPGGENRAAEVVAAANAGHLPDSPPLTHDAGTCTWFGCLTHHGPTPGIGGGQV